MKSILEKLFIKKTKNLLEENKVISERDYRSLITRSLILILVLTIIGSFSFTVYEAYQFGVKKEQREKSISSIEKDIKKLEGLTLKNTEVSKVEIDSINKEFANKKFVFGLETTTVDIVEKIRVTSTLKYFDIKVHFKSKDLDAVKRYVALVYLNTNVYKIVDIEKDHLKLIILGAWNE